MTDGRWSPNLSPKRAPYCGRGLTIPQIDLSIMLGIIRATYYDSGLGKRPLLGMTLTRDHWVKITWAVEAGSLCKADLGCLHGGVSS